MVEMYPYPTVFYSKSELFKGYGKDVGISDLTEWLELWPEARAES